jgi:isoleucyl-tRNA synthetase
MEVHHPLIDRKSKIILGEHVTLDAGTGLVHTAPGHGLEDYEVGVKYGIEVLSPLDSTGCWTEEGRIPELVGVPYYKGNDIVIDMLDLI